MKALGISQDRIELMGKPHLGAHYTAEDYRRYALDENARCAVCGRRATDVHHVVRRSTIHSWTVNTPIGRFVAMSPLFALCRGCHEKFHQVQLDVTWEWNDEDCREAWESGDILAHVCPPGHERIFDYGHYILTDTEGKETTIGHH